MLTHTVALGLIYTFQCLFRLERLIIHYVLPAIHGEVTTTPTEPTDEPAA